MSHNHPKLLMLLLCLPFTQTAMALSTDQDQPMNLVADKAVIDDGEGVSIYKGNVVVTQGSMELRGDTVTVYSPGRELQKVVAEGDPAHFKQRPDDKDEDIRARASTMEYYTEPERLVMIDGAQLQQEGDEFSGNRIEYNMATEVVNASMAESGQERVEVIIQPNSTGAQSEVPEEAESDATDDAAAP